MAGVSDAFTDGSGDIARELARLRRRIKRLETARPLEHSSIGADGIRLIGGSITVDEGGNIVVAGGRIIAGDPEGERAEITPTGYRLVNKDNEVLIDLTTDGNNEILLRSGPDEEDTEIQLSEDGAINCRVLNAQQVFINGAPVDEEAATEGPGGTPGANKETYTAIWSQSYRFGSRNTFDPRPVQGFYDSTNGNQRSLIGFDSGQIQADLAGASSIDTVRVFLYYNHWFFNSGGTAIIGWHGHSDEPSSFSATTDQIRVPGWPKPGGRWVDLPTSGWSTGGKKGVAIGPGPSTSRAYYGRAHGHTQSNPPRLEITWTV